MVKLALYDLKYYCPYGLYTSEYTEWIIRCIELEPQNLCCVSVDCAIHEAPNKCENVNQYVIFICLNLHERYCPDNYHAYHVNYAANFTANLIHNQSHKN